ncbi:peptidoglycan-binding protein [Patescibacteria group bacterium]|nr:peptidoglycan-binding protein [Patescibacteria group bacterium]
MIIKTKKSLFTIPIILFSILIIVFYLPTLVFSAALPPELPKNKVDITFPVISGKVIKVKKDCTGIGDCNTSLQQAIDNANLGDEIVIDSNMTIKGPITLKNKTNGSGWIVIRSSESSNLPAEVRVSPSQSIYMPKIISPGSGMDTLLTEDKAHHYRLVGIEIVDSSDDTNVLVELGTRESLCGVSGNFYKVCDTSVLSNFAHDIILDRMYIHGLSNLNVKRGVGLDSINSAVINSYISDIHLVGADSQAISGIYGPGPYKISNNYLEGAGENLMFGGDDPRVTNLIPSDIEFIGNYVYKPRSWKVDDSSYQGIHWSVKNLFELKNALRVFVSGNIFDGNWADGQSGHAIVFTVRNQEGNCPWCAVGDVTFISNIVRHASTGVTITGHDDHSPNNPGTSRIKISNNLWDDINGPLWGGAGRFVLLDSGSAAPGPSNIEITHNTVFETGAVLYSSGASIKPNLVFSDNVVNNGSYGVKGDDAAEGNGTLNTFFPGAIFSKNVLIGGEEKRYSSYSGNYFPSSISSVLDLGNFNILSTSQYHNDSTDGKDIGADMNVVNSLTAESISGKKKVTNEYDSSIVIYPSPYTTPYQLPVQPTIEPVVYLTPYSTPITVYVTPAITMSFPLIRTLFLGLKGSDVTWLQNFLIQRNFLNSKYNTGYFGILTRAGVRKYQCSKNIVCRGTEDSTGYGIVGKLTREAIRNESGF